MIKAAIFFSARRQGLRPGSGAGVRPLAGAWRAVVSVPIAAALLIACAAPTRPADVTAAASAARPAAAISLSPWRTLNGGNLAVPGAVFGMSVRPGAGAFVKLLAPTALALRGNDLLVADSGTGRVLRFDLALNTLSPVAGVSATPGAAVALGPDLSAWVLDTVTRQVQRIARDGRPMQTYRAVDVAPSTAAFALADGGATLLVADDSLRRWLEFRPVGVTAVSVQPGGGANGASDAALDLPADAPAVRGVDGLAAVGDTVYVLDRLAARVHVVRRNGQLIGQLGAGELKQPQALAADRQGRVFVVDGQDRSIKVLRAGQPAQVFDAAALRVQAIGGIAVDERFLAVSDRLTGQVVIHLVQPVRAVPKASGEAQP